MKLLGVCAYSAVISFALSLASLSVPSSVPVALLTVSRDLMLPANSLAVGLLPRVYTEIIEDTTPPAHAQLIFAAVTTALNIVLWTSVAAFMFASPSRRVFRVAILLLGLFPIQFATETGIAYFLLPRQQSMTLKLVDDHLQTDVHSVMADVPLTSFTERLQYFTGVAFFIGLVLLVALGIRVIYRLASRTHLTTR